MPLEACPDAELWSAICQDDKKAFDALFERYWTLLYNTAYAYLKDDDAASQIVHDIFLNLWQKRQVYEIQSFRSYLSTAARYHVYKVLKARKAENILYVEDYAQLEHSGHTQNGGDENITSLELERALQQSLRQLPKRCREIYSLSRTEQMSNAEIAEKLSISKRTVENQLTTALQYLRNALKFFPFQT
jgi:RNA polymerase sigma-70 factor (ECF subfamily)